MFNIGPLELMVLAIVGLIVLGPDKLPGLARDAARMLRTLRDLAQGARTQLRDELGPEFADIDLRNLNPRTAISRAVLGDGETFNELRGDLRKLDPRSYLQDALRADDGPATASSPPVTPGSPVSMTKPAADAGPDPVRYDPDTT